MNLAQEIADAIMSLNARIEASAETHMRHIRKLAEFHRRSLAQRLRYLGRLA